MSAHFTCGGASRLALRADPGAVRLDFSERERRLATRWQTTWDAEHDRFSDLVADQSRPLVWNCGPGPYQPDRVRRVPDDRFRRVTGVQRRSSAVPATACWLGLLLLALALHELAHALTAYWLDCDQEEAHIWPLGSLVGPTFVPRSSEHFLVALAGPLVSGAFFSALPSACI